MLKVENAETYCFSAAIRGMRNPLNSWERSDSCGTNHLIGKNDLTLMKKLCKGGNEHRKFARYMFITMDVTAPLYWWKEFDTYKFILPDPMHYDSNSCSTMHKIAAKAFEVDDFSFEHLEALQTLKSGIHCKYNFPAVLWDVIDALNNAREMYIETKDKKYWWQMIQLLPSSYNQKRTVLLNYENAFAIIKQRSGHKLDEWHTLIDALLSLPYVHELSDACLNKPDAQAGDKTPPAPPATGSNIKFHNEPSTDAIEKWYEENKDRIFRDWVTSPHLTSSLVLYHEPVNPPPWQITCQTAETHSDPNDRSVTIQANAEVQNDRKD